MPRWTIPPVAVEPGALAVDRRGGALAVRLGRLERLRRERRDRRRASAGAERGVATRDRAPAPGGAGDHVGDAESTNNRRRFGASAAFTSAHDVAGSEITSTRCTRASPLAARTGVVRRACATPSDASWLTDGHDGGDGDAIDRAGGSRFDGEVGIDRFERGLQPSTPLGQDAEEERRRAPTPTSPMAASTRMSATRSLGRDELLDQPGEAAEHDRRRQRRAGTRAGRSRDRCRRRSTKPSTTRADRGTPTLWPRPSAATLAVSLLEREPADDHDRGADHARSHRR